MAQIHVYLLGGFRVVVRGQTLGDEVWHRRKARQLFKILLTHRNRWATKEELVELLWPESDPDSASTNLRSVMHALRRALDVPQANGSAATLLADRDSVWLRSDAQMWVDADEFERVLEQADAAVDPAPLLRRADELYAGEYLPEDVYEDWSVERRERLKEAWTTLRFQLARYWDERGDPDAAATSLRELLRADPCDEQAARELMRLLTRHGRRSEAVRVYQALVRALRDDLDVEPSEITTVLFESELPHAPVKLPVDGAGAAHAARQPHHLPPQPGALIGRAAELNAATSQIVRDDVRLLTLVGAGGCGKTRLALEVGTSVRDEFARGVWFVDLSAARSPDQIVFAIGRELEVAQPLDGQSYFRRLSEAIGQDEVLLILDNFEQVLDGGFLVADLLSACPKLKIIVTSREALHLRWEHEFPVAPLAGPPPSSTSIEAIASSPAVSLFVQRAQAIKPDWRLSQSNAPAVSRLCLRLDCLPLAIELAAARIKLFEPEAMLARLEQRFDLLTVASRDVPERHQALRLAIDWSHQLLSDDERAAFRRAAVFAGGWTLDAAVRVIADPSVPSTDVLTTMQALVDKNLLRVAFQNDGEPRFSMLETIRDFAHAELTTSGELAIQQRRQADWCVQVAEKAEAELSGPNPAPWFDQLEREHDNFRAALRWCFDQGDGLTGMRLATALGYFWEVHGYLQEAHRWLELASQDRTGVSAAVRARACGAAGHVAFLRGDYYSARTLLTESLSLSREAGTAQVTMQALINLALVAMSELDYARADEFLQESRAIASNLGDERSLAASLNLLGQVALHTRRLADAHSLLQDSLHLRRAQGDGWGTARALCDLGQVLDAEGDDTSARALHAEALTIWRDLADMWGVAYALEGLAMTFATRSPEMAVRLLAVATCARQRVGIRALPAREANLHAIQHTCAGVLGEAAFSAAWSRGCQAELDSTIDEVLASNADR
ncbi:MAG: tetratricopeptide repeat protein [Chloroflexi bacterium]|nr:tetratricopeptide repeat protein [Chloroflexota bacterium]